MNAALLRFDSAGRITTLTVADFPAPHFNGGTPTGDLGSLVIEQTALPDAIVAGLGYTTAGALCVSVGGTPDAWIAGLPVDGDGVLIVSLDGTPAVWVAGIPLDASGRVCLASPTPPINLHAFNNAFAQSMFN